ncbi:MULTISPECIES: hypothetical protein [Sphingobacterium]|uniref:Uncharacterized protein n=1 Tax=Sphingobacterium tenebrionis TaxID=3111775 RepID=A0ABU8I2H7_9SPHI|nr:hypothetical protein [Sphingobacterium sp. CZ-2]QBR11058.1 hypothetical protein E3D81_02300 [Sphingobacterium sp. CZ-2]
MKSTIQNFVRCTVVILCFLPLYQCKKLINPEDLKPELLYDFKFEINNFTSIVEPFSSSADFSSPSHSVSQSAIRKDNTNHSNPYIDPSLLYLWRFNRREFQPDYVFASDHTPSVEFRSKNNGINTISDGFYTRQFPGDYALTGTNPEVFRMRLPQKFQGQLKTIEFEIGISEHSAKGFTLRAYKNDRPLPDFEQKFVFPTGRKEFFPHKRSYDVQEITKKQDIDYFQLQFDYPDNHKGSGTVKVDNIRIFGERRSVPHPQLKRKLMYMIYNEDMAHWQSIDSIGFGENASINLKLPEGDYRGAFLFAETSEELNLPSRQTAIENFRFDHDFSDGRARFFGNTNRFRVGKTGNSSSITLQRLYNQITIELTDVAVLNHLVKLRVSPINNMLSWTPFSNQLQIHTPVKEVKPIEIFSNFQVMNRFVFNHFVGNFKEDRRIDYKLELFNSVGVDQSTVVSIDVRSNVKVMIRGNMYPTPTTDAGFKATLDESWTDEKIIEF